MKGIFFPFSKKYSYLSKYAWHRFAVVFYWILIIFSLGGIWIPFQSQQVRSFNACYQTWMEITPNISLQSLNDHCGTLKPDTWTNFAVAVILVLVISYIVQVIYYKVILYVAFGKNKEVS